MQKLNEQVFQKADALKKLLDQMFIEEPDDNDTEQGVKLPVQ